jgi:hypothetical protein
MAGGNVTIFDLATQAVMASGDSVPAWSATGSYTYQVLATQISNAAFQYLTTATIGTAGVAALPTGPVGFLVVQLGTTSVRLPYYAV